MGEDAFGRMEMSRCGIEGKDRAGLYFSVWLLQPYCLLFL